MSQSHLSYNSQHVQKNTVDKSKTISGKFQKNNLVKNSSLNQKNNHQIEENSLQRRNSSQHNKALSGSINYFPQSNKNGAKLINSKKSTFAKCNKAEEIKYNEESIEKEKEIEEEMEKIEENKTLNNSSRKILQKINYSFNNE